MEAKENRRSRKTIRSGLTVLIVAALALTLAWPAQAGALEFRNTNFPFQPGAAPNSIATGFLNADAIPDIAGTNSGVNTITVGIFDQQAGAVLTDYPAGDSPTATAIGDLNADGNSDIVAANANSDNVTILLGDGTGAFTEPSYSPAALPPGSRPVSIVIAAGESDLYPEIATVNQDTDDVAILEPVGASYALGALVPAGDAPSELTWGDFNGDGSFGFVTANTRSGNLTVLLGDGSGGFQPAAASPIVVGSAPTGIASGDLNGDGSPDLAVSDADAADVTVLLGNGAGGFTEARSSPFAVGGHQALSVEIADMDGDGHEDIITANFGTSDVSVLLGVGDGGFDPAYGSPYPTGTEPVEVAVTDFFQDGIPDLVTVSPSTDSASALISRGWPHVTTSPTELAFPAQAVNTISPPMTTTITNSGAINLHVERVRIMGDHADDFLVTSDTCSGESIVPGATCRVGVRFAPSDYGAHPATLEILSDATHSPNSVAMSASTVPAQIGSPQLTATPTTLAYPNRLVNTISTRRVVAVTNTGTTGLNVDGVRTTGYRAGDFLISSETCTYDAIAPGASCQIGVRFAPSGLGPRTATLELRSDASTSPNAISLSGTGAAVPRNTALPTIKGTPSVGRRIACYVGSWSGTAPQTLSRQWLRNGKPIPGATGFVRRVRGVDQGLSLRCRVTARNSVGKATALSAAVKVPRS